MKYLLLTILISVSGSSIAQVGIGTATPNAKAALDISSTTQGLLPPRMDSIARNAITTPPAGLVIYNTSINAFQCFNGTSWYSTVHYIGEYYGGGIVFYVYDNGQHGLIAATEDQTNPATGAPWNDALARWSGSTGSGVGAGLINTPLIIANLLANNNSFSNFAALSCQNYEVTVAGVTYGDWYLPSKHELNLIYLQKTVLPGLSNDNYWTSTEISNAFAWVQSMTDGFQASYFKASNALVRAIRSF